jgi:hypothetical protein
MAYNRDNCLRQLIGTASKAADFCATYTITQNAASIGLPTYVSQMPIIQISCLFGLFMHRKPFQSVDDSPIAGNDSSLW